MYDCHQKIITVPAADAAGRSLWQKKAPQPEAEEPNLMMPLAGLEPARFPA